MRIAMVSEHASPLAALGGVDAGGQNVHVAALAAELTRRGHEVTVYTRRDDPDVATRLRAPGGYLVEHVTAGPPRAIAKDQIWPFMTGFGRQLAARWQHQRPDIVHAHFWMSGAAALPAARRLDIPIVQTFHALGAVKRRHQGHHDTSPAERVGTEQRLCAHVDYVIATCSDEVAELEVLGRSDRMSVVPCGVDVQRFTPMPGVEDGHHRLLCVGRVVERKGLADVVKAMTGLPGVELLIAGGPCVEALDLDPQVQRLRALAHAGGTADRVHFLGRVEHSNLPSVYAVADVVVSVPWYEPFGIVPLEAMACGRPVVGSAVGGMLDTVVRGVTGELVPPRRPDVLAPALRRLLADDRRRAAYGAAGVHRAVRHYSWQQVGADTDDVYTAVLAAAALSTVEVAR